MTRPVILSDGGGANSCSMLIFALFVYKIKIDQVVFCDVGDPEDRSVPGEWPGTYRHIEEVIKPLCKEHNIEFVHLGPDNYPVRNARSLYGWMKKRGQIPMSGPKRLCTAIAKVERFESWANDRYPGQEIEVWIGFDADEKKRAEKDPNAGDRDRKLKPGDAIRINRFPLIEWNICRCRCEEVIRAHGFPVPRKSACVFCPYSKRGDFQNLAEQLPETFQKVVDLEGDKGLTEAGYKTSLMGFRKHILSPAQDRLLRKIANNGQVTGRERQSLKALVRRSWATEDGQITEYGQEIIDGCKPEDKVGEVLFEDNPESKAKPVLGVHYQATPIAEWLQQRDYTRPEGCKICGAPVKATKRTGCDYLSEAEQTTPGHAALPVVLGNKLDKKIAVQVEVEDMASRKHLASTTKQPFGEVSLYQEASGEFTVEFMHDGEDRHFTHKSMSALAKHLYALKKGHVSVAAFEQATDKKVPGVGGKHYWGLDKTPTAPKKAKASKAKTKKKTAKKAKRTKAALPNGAKTPSDLPTAKMPRMTREGDDQFIAMIPGPKDPSCNEEECTLLDEVGEVSQAKWADLLRTLMHDGQRRTFNHMMVEIANIEASDCPDEANDALWHLVEAEGFLFHTVSRPIMFWRPQSGEQLPADVQAMVEAKS